MLDICIAFSTVFALLVNKLSDTPEVKPYMVNERLFTVPIKKCLLEDFKGDTEEEEEQKEPKKKPTAEDPRFVR